MTNSDRVTSQATAVVVTEAAPAAISTISELAIRTYVETFGAEFEPDEMAHNLDKTISAPRWREYLVRVLVLLAYRGDRAIGYVHFGAGENDGVTIHALYVDAAFQRHGIGSELLRSALADPVTAAAAVVRIDVWEKNPGARRLKERYGFRHEGEREPFVLKSGEIDGYDLILVRRQRETLA